MVGKQKPRPNRKRPPKEERAQYMKEYRARMSAEKKERQGRLMRARSRALTRLTGLHPEDFQMLYEDELGKEGISDANVRGMREAGVGVADDQQGEPGLLGELQGEAEGPPGPRYGGGDDLLERSGEEG